MGARSRSREAPRGDLGRSWPLPGAPRPIRIALPCTREREFSKILTSLPNAVPVTPNAVPGSPNAVPGLPKRRSQTAKTPFRRIPFMAFWIGESKQAKLTAMSSTRRWHQNKAKLSAMPSKRRLHQNVIVDGYRREHSSIYIYIYMYIYMSPGTRKLRFGFGV